MDVGGAERALPPFRRAHPDVAEHRGAGRHPLPELGGEGGERRLGNAERLQPAVGQCHVEPGAARGRPRGRRGDRTAQPPQHLPAVVPVVDAQQEVGTHVRRGARMQDAALDVGEVERRIGGGGRVGGGRGHGNLLESSGNGDLRGAAAYDRRRSCARADVALCCGGPGTTGASRDTARTGVDYRLLGPVEVVSATGGRCPSPGPSCRAWSCSWLSTRGPRCRRPG